MGLPVEKVVGPLFEGLSGFSVARFLGEILRRSGDSNWLQARRGGRSAFFQQAGGFWEPGRGRQLVVFVHADAQDRRVARAAGGGVALTEGDTGWRSASAGWM